MKVRDWVELLRHGKKVFLKKDAMPVYLIHFVTEVCNLRCSHCFDYFYEEGPKRKPHELTLDEIDKMTKSLGELLFLLPTGGEPFLRADLPKIIELYYKNCHLRNVGMPTNGSLTEKVVAGVEEILARCPDLNFGLDISIDGIGKDHDTIRCMNGLFEKCMETYRRLKEVEKHHSNFKVCVEVTIQKYNQHKLDEIYDYFTRELKTYNVLVRVVRGKPRDPAEADIDIDLVEQFTSKLERGIKEGAYHGHAVYPMSDFITARELVGRRIQIDLLKSNSYQIPCYAANLMGVIKSNGDVMACELRDDKLGNIREHDYDFRKLWLSSKAKAISKDILDNKCFCTHECFMSTNILFNPTLLPRLAGEVAGLRLARLRGPQPSGDPQETGPSVDRPAPAPAVGPTLPILQPGDPLVAEPAQDPHATESIA
jgi:MoaA/NifB/PqqE/SkfB family radical SAM enzyme